jgi:hypothetical protein
VKIDNMNTNTENTTTAEQTAAYDPHDYEASEDRSSQMQTDPPCAVCGFRESNPVHGGGKQ